MKVISVLFCLCIVLQGCKDSAVIWSGESLSPDGQWVATAQTEQFGGLGTAGVFTSVYLGAAKSHKTIEVLTLSNESAYPDGITSIAMTWVTPVQLHISYKGEATTKFQVVKYSGIEISVSHAT